MLEKNKQCYFFGFNQNGKNLTEGDASMRNSLGGKGSNLAEMSKIGLPVPSGFTISAEACINFYESDKKLPEQLIEEINKNLETIENCQNKTFGDINNPLLLSVRSGARVSMPGMMDTILNLGLNDETVKGLAKISNNPRFAYDSYRRFIQMYSSVVMNIHSSLFESRLERIKEKHNIKNDYEIEAKDLQTLVEEYKMVCLEEKGLSFPQNPKDQLLGAVTAVFDSWNSQRAIHYRNIEKIPDNWGTAVNIQSMVFGNSGENSGTGVAFTRNPATGDNDFFGEFLVNAQGEDVVAGIRTPNPISVNQKNNSALNNNSKSMEETMPEAYNQLFKIQNKLENHYKDVQDIEFTIDNKILYILQTRNAKRTAKAAFKVAVDMVEENLITKEDAILKINPNSIEQLLHPQLDPDQKKNNIAKGLPASPGAVSGKIVFSADHAVTLRDNGEAVILVRHETSPEDVHGMEASKGILTALGGMTSHAAVVARGMGKCCIAGCAELKINYQEKKVSISQGHKNIELNEGDVITLDGNTGDIFLGEISTIESTQDKNFQTIMEWCHQIKTMDVRCNADTPKDCKVAVDFGAQGVGLCRTEHMFFDPQRIEQVRAMILASNFNDRDKALKNIKPMQKNDFLKIFKVMNEKAVTIRLLDPPLHEFLPHDNKGLKDLADKLNLNFNDLSLQAKSLEEVNPMLGHRGCRLGLSFPEIYNMQAEAIFEAFKEAWELGIKPKVEVMIPLICSELELTMLIKNVKEVLNKTITNKEILSNIKIGTMIELPRACLIADKIAPHVDFISFGTNDLTQTTLGLSRDDSGKFIGDYIKLKIFNHDPFASIDVNGVGELVKIAVEKVKPSKIKVGVCGEHGGDPESINFFSKLNFDYVSCSPYRVPVAILACAQAKLKKSK